MPSRAMQDEVGRRVFDLRRLAAVHPDLAKLKAVAHTLPYDIALIDGHHRSTPLSSAEWAPIQIPALVGVGGKSPTWVRRAMRALADALPDARHHTLEGQTHMVKPKELAPVFCGVLRQLTHGHYLIASATSNPGSPRQMRTLVNPSVSGRVSAQSARSRSADPAGRVRQVGSRPPCAPPPRTQPAACRLLLIREVSYARAGHALGLQPRSVQSSMARTRHNKKGRRARRVEGDRLIASSRWRTACQARRRPRALARAAEARSTF